MLRAGGDVFAETQHSVCVLPALHTQWPNAHCSHLCRLADACKAVLMRSGDTEESIQDMVAKVFHRWATNYC